MLETTREIDMKQLTFLREDVVDKHTVSFRQCEFPKDKFLLKSGFSGIEIVVEYLDDESQQLAIDNEFWDGEQEVALYGGKAPNGDYITVKLWHTPEDLYGYGY